MWSYRRLTCIGRNKGRPRRTTSSSKKHIQLLTFSPHSPLVPFSSSYQPRQIPTTTIYTRLPPLFGLLVLDRSTRTQHTSSMRYLCSQTELTDPGPTQSAEIMYFKTLHQKSTRERKIRFDTFQTPCHTEQYTYPTRRTHLSVQLV